MGLLRVRFGVALWGVCDSPLRHLTGRLKVLYRTAQTYYARWLRRLDLQCHVTLEQARGRRHSSAKQDKRVRSTCYSANRGSPSRQGIRPLPGRCRNGSSTPGSSARLSGRPGRIRTAHVRLRKAPGIEGADHKCYERRAKEMGESIIGGGRHVATKNVKDVFEKNTRQVITSCGCSTSTCTTTTRGKCDMATWRWNCRKSVGYGRKCPRWCVLPSFTFASRYVVINLHHPRSRTETPPP